LDDAVYLDAPALPEGEQVTGQFLQPGLDTVPEAPDKTLTGLVEARQIRVIAHRRIVPQIADCTIRADSRGAVG
jgi:hypothetical protein